MRGVAYVNGTYVPLRNAAVSVHDRGFQLGDAVYEVWAVRAGHVFDGPEHIARLQRSLTELRIPLNMTEAALNAVIREVMRRNHLRDGIVYLQVSRGAPASRDHVFPAPGTKPTLVVLAKNLDRAAMEQRAATGVKVISAPDIRWGRRDIKSVNLLPNVLARQAAKERGAFEAWLIDPDGYVTEGTSSSAWIVDKNGVLRTRPLSHDLLHGVTRAALARIARERQMKLSETPFTIAEAQAAHEAFLTSASNAAVPVIAIDDKRVGIGRPGPIAKALRAAYLGAAASD